MAAAVKSQENIKAVGNLKLQVPPVSAAQSEDHAGHPAEAMSPDKAEMAQEMGHGTGHDLEGIVRDMRNRLLVKLALAILIYLYAPMAP